MRERFDRQLEELKTEMALMGSLCEEIFNLVSLDIHDYKDRYKEIKEVGYKIDELEKNIQNLCFKLVLHEQPVAVDLRIISAALKMITDMERIGDQAEDISDILKNVKMDNLGHRDNIIKMLDKVVIMVNDSVTAWINQDLDLARHVIDADDEVDELFMSLKNDFINDIKACKVDAFNIVDMLMIVKYLERVGDHSVNIAEWVIFSVMGYNKSFGEGEK